ncbi:hypothetical protein GHU05_04925 [Fructobacillus tropaeoli]|nr:hypothetical protein [Fructobacillus tropaeoli]
MYAKRSGKFKVRKKSIVVYAEVAVFDCAVKGNDGLIPASKGDYIITEADGNRYPLKPDDFKKNYEII